MFECHLLEVMIMKVILVLLLSTFVSSSVVDNHLFGKKQTDTLILLKNIYQPLYDPDFLAISETYRISENQEYYTKQEVVEDFLEYYNEELLPKGRIFSAFHEEHLKEAIALFRLFYYAKNYEAFLKTAIWARQNVNEGLFLYSYLVALVHRQDTKDIIIPPIHEINPYYFFSADVIHEAQVQKLKNSSSFHIDITSSLHSGLYPDQSLSYYLEDVGILCYYFYYSIYYPFWMRADEYGFENVNRGEQFYFFHQQLLARYYQERLSNGLGEVPFINWNLPIDTPFYPSLEYPNGLEFPNRPFKVNLEEYFYNYGQSWTLKGPYGYSFSFVNDYERRINDDIDTGFIFNRVGKTIDIYSPDNNGLDILGTVIQSNYDSPCHRFYGPLWIYASHLLGYSYQPLDKYKLAPSVLEHFETAPRDPIFYQIYKKLTLKYQRYYKSVPPYKKKDLIFKGVQVKEFSVSPLYTYKDYFHSDISNALYLTPQELEHNEINFDVRQERLNSEIFTYNIKIQSEQSVRSVVKIFLGPKYDEFGRYINLAENRINMVLLDYFVFDLKAGENDVVRNSSESYYYGHDSTSFADLFKKFVIGSNEEISSGQNYFFFPLRFILPKGSASGSTYQFYVIFYPFKPKSVQLSKTHESYYYPFVDNQQFYDSYSLGYPFDRFIRSEKLWNEIPNSRFHTVKIYHRDN